MCGIFALLGEANPELGEYVAHAMHHRGPDDRGVWTSTTGAPVTLVNTRLAIIDLSSLSHMPVTTPRNDW
jgi:asparagine synthetase B (glutamine-hydrolysing)